MSWPLFFTPSLFHVAILSIFYRPWIIEWPWLSHCPRIINITLCVYAGDMKNVQRQYFKRNNSIFLLLNNKSLKFKYSIFLKKEGGAFSCKNQWKDVWIKKFFLKDLNRHINWKPLKQIFWLNILCQETISKKIIPM